MEIKTRLRIIPTQTKRTIIVKRGEELRDEGMELVLEHQSKEWKQMFTTCYHAMVRSGRTFTSEDIVNLVGPPPGHPNAVGAIFSALVKPDLDSGAVDYLGHVKTKNPKSHASRIGQYRGVLKPEVTKAP